MFSYGAFHMNVPVLADQQEPTYNSFVQTQDVVWKFCQEGWMIGTNSKRESRKAMLAAQLDDDDDDDDDNLINIFVRFTAPK